VGRFDTDEPAPIGIPARILNELCEHAREAEPEECCGLVLSEGALRYGRAVRCRNEMSQPESRSAYSMSMRDVLGAIRETERSGERVTAVYHSHVGGAGAYLSPSDLEYARNALFPFPDADQIVLSVYEGSVREIKLFARSGDEFSERLARADAT
jgi:proteasome lid subunit RPN8/RPN11